MELIRPVQNEKSLVRPEIAKYRDYRLFLQDFYQFKKSHRNGFSFRKFAELAGMKSPNYLQLVIQGKRNLTLDSAQAVSAALRLSKVESSCFVALVRLSLPEEEEMREKAYRDHLASLGAVLKKQIPKEKNEVLEHWHHLVLREVMIYMGSSATLDQISEHLRGILSTEEIERSLELLLRTGFLKHEADTYVQDQPVVETGDGFGELRIIRAHREILQNWARYLELFPAEERELGVINIPIHSSKIPEFKKRIRQFQNEIVGWLQSEDDPDSVVQLGTYLIPITRKKCK